jgi:hypothetical protein
MFNSVRSAKVVRLVRGSYGERESNVRHKTCAYYVGLTPRIPFTVSGLYKVLSFSYRHSRT